MNRTDKPADRRCPPRLTVGQVVSWWLEKHAPACSAAHDHERRRILRMFIATIGADLPLRDVKPLHLLEFLNRPVCPQCFGREHVRHHRRCVCAHCNVTVPFNHASAWTVRRWALHIRGPFNAAVRLGLAGFNPFAAVSLPTGERGRDLSDDEFRSLLRRATPTYRRLLIFLRYCGCRPGEMKRVEWPNVDWTAGVITLRSHKTAKKVRAPRRIVMCRVVTQLLNWIQRHEPHEQLVFVNSRGRPWRTEALCKYLRALRRRAGLSAEVKLYSCRHAYATAAIMRGVDIASLGELLGHRQFATTAHYLHCGGKRHLAVAAEIAAGSQPAPAAAPIVFREPPRPPRPAAATPCPTPQTPNLVDQATKLLDLLLKRLS